MKIIKLLLPVFLGFFLLIACQKELSFEAGNTGELATGTLKDTLGNCKPVSVFGTYVVDSTLNANHYVLIQANFTTAGVYSITTNLINGFSFSDSGYVSTPGAHTIKLKATGKPTLPIATEFDVQFGTSFCKITVTVAGTPGGGGTAVYALTGLGGACSNANVQGNYTVGTALTPNNTAVLQVNVTTPGTYTLTTVPINGITFTGSGTFAAAGAATITLTGSGTPANAGQTTIPVTAGISACGFPVTVTPQGGGSAAFTFAGSPGPCANANVQGTYTAGTALTAANKVTIQVNVTTAGSYNITSAPVNGMTFSRSGTFTTTGAQSVDLQGTGIPTAAGNQQVPIVAGTSVCAFTVSVNQASGSGGSTSPDSAWSFNEGTLFFFGRMDTAFLTTTAGVGTVLNIGGSTYHTGDSLISIYVRLPGSTVQPGTYSTSSNTIFYFAFNGANPAPFYSAEPSTNNAVMSVVITSYNSTTRVVHGIFSGNAQTPAGALVPITNGKFRAMVAQ